MKDNGLPDEKIIAVCKDDAFYKDFRDINELPKHIMDEIKHFFAVYKTLEGKETAVDVVTGKEEAIKVIKESMEKYKREIEPKLKELRGY